MIPNVSCFSYGGGVEARYVWNQINHNNFPPPLLKRKSSGSSAPNFEVCCYTSTVARWGWPDSPVLHVPAVESTVHVHVHVHVLLQCTTIKVHPLFGRFTWIVAPVAGRRLVAAVIPASIKNKVLWHAYKMVHVVSSQWVVRSTCTSWPPCINYDPHVYGCVIITFAGGGGLNQMEQLTFGIMLRNYETVPYIIQRSLILPLLNDEVPMRGSGW